MLQFPAEPADKGLDVIAPDTSAILRPDRECDLVAVTDHPRMFEQKRQEGQLLGRKFERLAVRVCLSRLLVDPHRQVCSRKTRCLNDGCVRVVKLQPGCGYLDHIAMAELSLADQDFTVHEGAIPASRITYQISPRLTNDLCMSP